MAGQSETNNTKSALLTAAAEAFNANGFAGTDTNRIARAAGFAPQTFYRHFRDKTDIFIQVYDRWQEDERRRVEEAVRNTPDTPAQALAIAAALIAAHREWAGLRRSLRRLAVEDCRIRAARAVSRRSQLAVIGASAPWPAQVATLLTIERLCDAAADSETDDLQIEALEWTTLVAEAIERLRQ